MKRLLPALIGLLALSGAALAQEQEDTSSTFKRIKGGAVFDFKEGVDGTPISEEYMLTHVVCSDGSKTLRVMLPLGPEDDGTAFTMDGEPSTLKRHGSGYTVEIKVGGKRISKNLELKPLNDGKAHYKKQFMFRLDYGDALWTAMLSEKSGSAMMLIGTGGAPIGVPATAELTAALKSCGLPG